MFGVCLLDIDANADAKHDLDTTLSTWSNATATARLYASFRAVLLPRSHREQAAHAPL
ncbi:hypothetical protein B0H34DRAFT_343002 [Crassisporium funariophilum]|nr:hypothetical protein B0H34DRAFT_343002 [Crassisporium funariophilum]